MTRLISPTSISLQIAVLIKPLLTYLLIYPQRTLHFTAWLPVFIHPPSHLPDTVVTMRSATLDHLTCQTSGTSVRTLTLRFTNCMNNLPKDIMDSTITRDVLSSVSKLTSTDLYTLISHMAARAHDSSVTRWTYICMACRQLPTYQFSHR